MKFQKACKKSDVPKGEMRAFKVGDQSLIIYHIGNSFHATQANCTHMFAPLARGKIVDGCEVQCPLHRARFDIASGHVVEWANFPPGIQLLNALRGKKALKTFTVELRENDVFVKV